MARSARGCSTRGAAVDVPGAPMAARLRCGSPLTMSNDPPAYKFPFATVNEYTIPSTVPVFTLGFQGIGSAVVTSTAARPKRFTPPIVVNQPPMITFGGMTSSEYTSKSGAGFQEVGAPFDRLTWATYSCGAP